MAYKFQLGAAKLGGNLTAADANGDGVISGSIGRFTHLSCSAESIIVGSTTLSEAEIGLLDGFVAGSNTAVDIANDSIIFFDSGVAKFRRETVGNFMTDIADGTHLEQNGNQLRIKDAGVTSAKIADNAVITQRIADEAVTLAKLAHAAANTVLVRDANSTGDPSFKAVADTQILIGDGSGFTAAALSGDVTMDNAGAVTIAANAVQDGMVNDDVATGLAGDGLSASSGVMAVDLLTTSGLEISSNKLRVDLETSNALALSSNGLDLKSSIAGSRTFESNLTVNGTASIGGDLIVQGTTVTLDVATVGITGSFSFEGSSADDYETVLGVIDPTADRTINLPNQSGTIPVLAAASTTQITATPEELNVLDGLAQGSILLGDGSGAAAILDAKTDGQIMVGDGTTVASVAVSGDATLAANGALTIGTGVVEHAMLAADCIDGDNIQDDVINSEHIAALSIDTEHIGNLQVTNGKLAAAAVTTAKLSLGSQVLSTGGDHILFLDGGASGGLNSETIISFANKMSNGTNSGLDDDNTGKFKLDLADLAAGAIASGDSIGFVDANDSDKSKKETVDDLATLFAGSGIAATSAVLAVDTSGSLSVASTKLGISGSLAGNGLSYAGGVNSVSELFIGTAQIASGMIEDNAVITQRINDGAVTTAKLAADAVDGTRLADDAVASEHIADNAVITARIADEAVTYAKMQHVSATARILGRNTSGAGDVEEVTPAQVMGMFNSDLGGNFTIGDQSSDTATFSGGLTVNGTASVGGDLTITGDLQVNGTTTTVNSTELLVTDKNISMGSGSANDAAADGGGITLISGDGNKTFNWVDSTDAWTSSEHLDMASGKMLKIAGAEVLSAIGAVKVQSSVAGNGLAHSSGVLSVGVDDSSIELSSNAVRVKAAGIATAMIADDAVTPAKLSIFDDSLAATDTHIMIADGSDYSSFALSGDATLSNAGVLTIGAAKVQAGMLNANVISAQSACTDPQDADELLWSDAGVIKKLGADDLKDYVSSLRIGDNPGTNLVIGVNFFDDFGSDASFSRNLPASPSVGDSVMVKAPSDCGVSKTITIARQGSHTIDGVNSIVLESPHAAVQCVYVKTNTWKVF